MRILFQGDSITDAGRVRDNDGSVGLGYPLLVKAALGYSEPLAHEFINRGISGNRIVDVYARIKKDIINVKPDIMSILIGVNDVWHEFSDSPNGVDADKFYKIYDMLITEVKEALPDIKIMIMEPFMLEGNGTSDDGDKLTRFRTEVEKRAVMAKRIADEHGLTFIPLQAGFDSLAEKSRPNYWLGDGVHPTPMGHEYIKTQWLSAFNTIR